MFQVAVLAHINLQQTGQPMLQESKQYRHNIKTNDIL